MKMIKGYYAGAETKETKRTGVAVGAFLLGIGFGVNLGLILTLIRGAV